MNTPFAESVLYQLPDHIVKNIFENEIDYSGITALSNLSASLKDSEKAEAIISGIESAKEKYLITGKFEGRVREVIDFLLNDLSSPRSVITKTSNPSSKEDLLEQFYITNDEIERQRILGRLRISSLKRKGLSSREIRDLYLSVAKNQVPNYDFSFKRRFDSLFSFNAFTDREFIIPELVKIAKSDDKYIANIASALLIMGDGKEAFRSLIVSEVLSDNSSQALATLAFLSSQDKSAREILISLLGSGDENVFKALAKLQEDVFCDISCDHNGTVTYYHFPEKSISLTEIVDKIGLENICTTSLFSLTAQGDPIHLFSHLPKDFLIPRIASFIYREENRAGLHLLDQVGLSALGEPIQVLEDRRSALQSELSSLRWWKDIWGNKRADLKMKLDAEEVGIRVGSIDFMPDNYPGTEAISKNPEHVSIIRDSFNSAHQIIDLADKFNEVAPGCSKWNVLDGSNGKFSSEVERVRKSFPRNLDFDLILEHVFLRLDSTIAIDFKRKTALAIILVDQDRDAFINKFVNPALKNKFHTNQSNLTFAVSFLMRLSDDDLSRFIQDNVSFKKDSEVKDLSCSLMILGRREVIISALLDKLRSCEKDLFTDRISPERLNIETIIKNILNYKDKDAVIDNIYLIPDEMLFAIYKENVSSKTRELICKQWGLRYRGDLDKLKEIFYPLILDESDSSNASRNRRRIALSYLLSSMENEYDTASVLSDLIRKVRDPLIQYELCRDLYSSSLNGEGVLKTIIMNDISSSRPSYPLAYLCDLMTLTHNKNYISILENICRESYPKGAFKQAFLNLAKIERPDVEFINDSGFFLSSYCERFDLSKFLIKFGCPYLLKIYNDGDEVAKNNIRELFSVDGLDYLPEQFAGVFSSGLGKDFTGPILEMGRVSDFGKECFDADYETLTDTPKRIPSKALKPSNVPAYKFWEYN